MRDGHADHYGLLLGIIVILPFALFLLLRSIARTWLGRQPESGGPATIAPVGKMRAGLAVGTCIGCALVGALVAHRGWKDPPAVAGDVGIIWIFVGVYLDGIFSRAYWHRLSKPIAKSLQDARQGNLPKASPVTSVIKNGGLLLLVIGFILRLRSNS